MYVRPAACQVFHNKLDSYDELAGRITFRDWDLVRWLDRKLVCLAAAHGKGMFHISTFGGQH